MCYLPTIIVVIIMETNTVLSIHSPRLRFELFPISISDAAIPHHSPAYLCNVETRNEKKKKHFATNKNLFICHFVLSAIVYLSIGFPQPLK